MAEYRYGMRLRGFSPCCQPKEGLIRREDDTTGKYHDIIVYDRELTEKELAEYELDDLEYKSDAQRLTELLQKHGFTVNNAIEGLEITRKDLTIGCSLQPDPDEDNRTDCLFFSSKDGSDGFYVNFKEGCPEDEEHEILRCLRGAFDEEKTMHLTEAVEVCPYCGAENVYKNRDTGKQGYIVVCQQCGREIFLCDECLHAEDNKGQICNWREVQEPDSGISGRCFRGETKKACGGEP